jgi:hypothetical protein
MGINPATEVEDEQNQNKADPKPLRARQLFWI